jgi:hypothetical protein
MNSDHRGPNRAPATFLQAINPVWWLGDVERNPNWSRWQWFLRNPLCNFHAVIIGVADCFRTVYWSKSPWSFAPDGGWNYGYTIIDGGCIPLPFISWRGKRIECMIGWKTSGFFGYALRRANSPNATEQP